MTEKSTSELLAEIEDLRAKLEEAHSGIDETRARLDEAEDVLRAIRCGEVDSLVVSGVGGEQIFTLKGADYAYRLLIENMHEGALILAPDGIVLYSNSYFANIVTTPLKKVIGSSIYLWLDSDGQIRFQELMCRRSREEKHHLELSFFDSNNSVEVPVYLSVNNRLDDMPDHIFMVVTDMTEINKRKIAEAKTKALKARAVERERLLGIIEGASDFIGMSDVHGKILYFNSAARRMVGLPDDADLSTLEMKDIQPEWATKKVLDEGIPTVLRDGSWRNDTALLHRDGHEIPISQTLLIHRDTSGEPQFLSTIIRDTTEQRRSEKLLKQIEWMLGDSKISPQQPVAQDYGDLTQLNTSRVILDAVGAESLTNIDMNFIYMLETSSAIYEKNGDYALSVFASGWCKLMDKASRQLCGTPDNSEALSCGRWLCHESCWKEASLKSIETGQPTDIECAGGIRLYAVPIHAGEEIIGSINFGYGDPPHDPARLQELAEKYGVDTNALSVEAEAYQTRPSFIIEQAKRRLLSSAQLIGEIVQRKRAEILARQHQIAIETTHDGFLLIDNKGFLLKANSAYAEMIGYSLDELGGMHISQLEAAMSPDEIKAKINKIIIQGWDEFDTRHRHKEGHVIDIEINISFIADARQFVTFCRNITQRKLAEEEIKQLAFYDQLTQLPNRRLLNERLKHSINLERRDRKQLALLMLDLDNFKAVNDNFGHLVGDELLQQVSMRITKRLRDIDMVARLGGDEFVVLLENITLPEDAARVAKEIIVDLSKPFCLTKIDNVKIGVSIGICLYPQHGDSPEMLMDHADKALYQAKDAGRGCFAYFNEDLTRATKKRLELEIRLRHAIEHNELRVFYQLQMDIDSGQIVGAEALIRWQDPIHGLIQPIDFIPIAEETGLIVEIGVWVLHETCRQGKQWLDMGLPPLTLAVNISAQQFRRTNICALVTSVLDETGFPADCLELEITESGLMNNCDKAIVMFKTLRALGISIAIDDFGTGYSSLAYLKHFPLNVLKIDKSFIDDIPLSQDSMKIASTIIAMGHILGFKVLAEGVETPEQLAFLQEKDCDMYQGYIKSKPVSADEFVELLRKQ
jgi:diguanylate cyclase (GGDEF)-like protein/PAS domain S-box-containing protein